MESSIWTKTGTVSSPMPNPFSSFAAAESVEFLAVQLPGRGARRSESHPHDLSECAKQTLMAMKPMITHGNCPYVVIGYSMGSWLAFEICQLALKENLQLPVHFIATAMISPNVPVTERPWKPTSTLDTQAFQEQLRNWGCNDVLFEPDMWKIYEPLLRADHNMLDTYIPKDAKEPLGIPCSVIRGKDDVHLSNNELFMGWFDVLYTPEEKYIIDTEGDHGLIFDAKHRENLFNKVIDILEKVLLEAEYGP